MLILVNMKILVSKENVLKNVISIKNRTDSNICAVIKADAYSHGAVEIAHTIEEEVRCFAVATYSEAKELVLSGIKKEIIILGADGCDNEKNIIPTIVSATDVKNKIGYRRYNVAVNTGMNRLGIDLDDSVFSYLDKNRVFSIYSHVYSPSSVTAQANLFENFVKTYKSGLSHLYSSAYMFNKPKFDMVRPGIALYGYGYDFLKPAMTVYAEIVWIKNLKKGESVGYGDFKLKYDCKIATLKVGYRDGFSRLKPNEKRYVVINGKSCEIVGQICMDMCMANVSEVAVKVGDFAYLFSKDLNLDDISRERKTISYEVLSTFHHREDIIYK